LFEFTYPTRDKSAFCLLRQLERRRLVCSKFFDFYPDWTRILFKRVPQRAFLGVFEEPIVFCCDDTDRVRGSLAHRGADNRKKQPKATSLEPALPSTSRADKQDLVISNIAMELFKFLTRKKSTSALITTLSLYNNLQSYSEGEQSTQPVTLLPNICLASVFICKFLQLQ